MTEADLEAAGIDLRPYRKALAGPDRAWWLAHLARKAGVVPAFRRASGRLNVGFVAGNLASHGGIESFHALLLPRLMGRPGLDVVGHAVLNLEAGAPADALRAAGVPLGGGAAAVRALAAASDVLVASCLPDPGQYDPPGRRPPLLVVSHADDSIPWSAAIMASAAGRAARYVGVSPDALRPVPADRRGGAIVLPNAVDPSRLAPSAGRATLRARFGWHAPTLLGLGRLSEEKRWHLAIEALRHLPGWRLALAGDGPLRGGLAALAGGPDLAGRVDFLGPRADVGDLLAAADVAIAPSRTEGFGLAVAEALWAACPVAACPVGVLADPEAGRRAELVPVDAGPDAWAAAILAADRLPRLAFGRAWARDHLDPGPWADRWAELIAATAGPTPPPVAAAGPPEPPGPAAPPGPGAVLHRWLSSRPARLLGFGPAEGCGCASDAAAMDAAGVDGVLADLDAWTDRLARKPQAANVPRRAIRWAIRRACRVAAAAAHHHHES